MRSKPITKTELLAAVEAKLSTLRSGYRPMSPSDHAQVREMAQWTLGQIVMLDEVRSMLIGTRRSFI